MPLPTNSPWADEVHHLSKAPLASVVARYEQLFNEQPRSRNRVSLLRCIAWRLQANLYGGLSQRALERARMEVVKPLRPPTTSSVCARIVSPGRILM